MAKPQKRKVSGQPSGSSRVTPKGTRPQGASEPGPTSRAADLRVSPAWVPVLMFGLLLVGTLMILLNYVDLLPGGTSNWYLLGGLVLILAGIVAATQLH